MACLEKDFETCAQRSYSSDWTSDIDFMDMPGGRREEGGLPYCKMCSAVCAGCSCPGGGDVSTRR